MLSLGNVAVYLCPKYHRIKIHNSGGVVQVQGSRDTARIRSSAQIEAGGFVLEGRIREEDVADMALNVGGALAEEKSKVV